MLIYVKNNKKKKKNFLRTDGRTDGQPKTIVRNLTKLEENLTETVLGAKDTCNSK